MSEEERAALRVAIEAEHRLCGPKYEGCYAHFPMPHCRADGMAWPCDVARLAAWDAEREPGDIDCPVCRGTGVLHDITEVVERAQTAGYAVMRPEAVRRGNRRPLDG